MRLSSPIEHLASALFQATIKDLPDIIYRDRNWEAFHAWKKTKAREELAALYQGERVSGVAMGPPESFVTRVRRPDVHDVEVDLFPQTWPSTALGFEGIGGAAMTPAYTVIITCLGSHAIYFGGRFAYLIPALLLDGARNPKLEAFHHDFCARAVASCKDAVDRYGAVQRSLAQADDNMQEAAP